MKQEIKVDRNNWKVGKNNYQDYLTACSKSGNESETTIGLYNESLKEFKRSNIGRLTKTPTGEFKYDREKDMPIYHKKSDRLLFLGFESKLKRLVLNGKTIIQAFKDILEPLPTIVNPFDT